MPWTTPQLSDLRQLNRDNITAALRSGPMIPNSVLRVMADSNSGLAFLCLMYLDWLSLQLLPDTCEEDWLLRWAAIKNVSIGAATYASGTITVTGIASTPIPANSQLTATTNTATGGSQTLVFQTTALTTMGSGPTSVPFVALTSGETGLQIGSSLSFVVGISGVSGSGTIATFTDGIDADTVDEIRANVLDALRQPPMGGDANDYVQWAMGFTGVTRAWCSPSEMGPGTVTLRFMMDNVRATTNPLTDGFPLSGDVTALTTYLDTKRPVAVLDFFCEAPTPQAINVAVSNLVTTASQGAPVTAGTISPTGTVTGSDIDAATAQNIVDSIATMLTAQGAPAYALNGVAQSAQTIVAVWISDAVLNASGVISFDFSMSDQVMANDGCIAVMGTVTLS